MTLCGVLKDILLVCASILIWGTPVSLLQFFGYSIALGGMVYYRLGADSIKSFFSEAGRRWAEYGARKPAQRKIVTFGGFLFLMLMILIGVAPTLGYDATAALKSSRDWFASFSTGGQNGGN